MDLPASKPFSPSMRHSDKERWICIYPVYLNSRVTRAKGRKVSIKQGVDNPKHSEICAILQNMGLRHLAENKVLKQFFTCFRFTLGKEIPQKRKTAGALECS